MLWKHLGLKRKKRCLNFATLLGSHGLNLGVEGELITFAGNELLSSEVRGIAFFSRKIASCLLERGTRFFACMWNSSWGTAELLAAGEEA